MNKSVLNNLANNEIRVLRTIYESGPISRVNLARLLGLTRGSMSLVTKQLLQLGLITEVGKGNSSINRGRREVLLHVEPNAGFVISIHIALEYISYGIVNLNGEIISKNTEHYEYGSSPEFVLDLLTKGVTTLINEKLDKGKEIFGIGVALPGIIDDKEGKAKEHTIKGWDNFPLKERIEQRLGIKTFLENDVKTITLGEYQFGTGNHVRNMTCFWLEDGIGTGVITNGRLLRGVTSSAGEIGFSEFIFDLPSKKSILTTGHSKFWGDLLSFTNIKATIRRGLNDGWTSTLTNEATIEDFIKATEKGDAFALYIIKLLGNIVGTACMYLIYAYNPQVLLLSGPLFHRAPLLVDEIRLRLKEGDLRTPIDATEIRTSVLGEDGVTIGCAALVLDHLLNAAVIDLENYFT